MTATGAGLFAGSGVIIHETGPATFLWPIPGPRVSSPAFGERIAL